ncbi:MAG: hypothetical protein DI543_25035, partial [Bradyrhizobium icense]
MRSVSVPVQEGHSPSLDERLGTARAASLRSSLASQPFRRLSDVPERVIEVSRLCQMVHVDLDATSRRLVLGDEANPYYIDDRSSAFRAIEAALHLGIRRFYLQAVPSAPRTADGVLDAMTATVT